MTNVEALGNEIIRIYQRIGFGRVLKSEIDLLVFHSLLFERLGDKFKSEIGIHYYNVDKSEIYRLSLVFGMTESRFKRFFEDDFLLRKESVAIRPYILDVVNSRAIRERPLKEGKIQLLLANPIAKKALEERMYSVGGIVDFGNNSEIALVEIYDLLRLIEFTEEKKVAEIIRHNILAKRKIDENDPEINKFFKELERIPVEQRLKRIALGLAEKVIGSAGEEIVGAFFDAIRGGEKKK
jgi:hypothetical protein